MEKHNQEGKKKSRYIDTNIPVHIYKNKHPDVHCSCGILWMLARTTFLAITSLGLHLASNIKSSLQDGFVSHSFPFCHIRDWGKMQNTVIQQASRWGKRGNNSLLLPRKHELIPLLHIYISLKTKQKTPHHKTTHPKS